MTGILYWASVLLYLCSAVVALAYLGLGGRKTLMTAMFFAVFGALTLVASAGLRFDQWRVLPMTTPYDALNLLILFTTLIALGFMQRPVRRSLLCFTLPPVAFVLLVNGIFAHRYLGQAPRGLSGSLLPVHVGLAFFSYALFLVASITSAAYVYQSLRLKKHRTSGLFQKLPSLEELDSTLYRLIRMGYILFFVTLILGLCWTWLDRELLAPQWWRAPRVVVSLIMVIFYALSFHARRFGLLRGPKLAYVVCIGFSIHLAAYVVRALANLDAYRFWGPMP